MSKVIDDYIFEIEDYIGGNIEGVEQIDRMGLTVFLRKTLKDFEQSPAPELVRMMEEALPETPKNLDQHTSKEAFTAAIDQTRTRLTAIIERELG